MHPYVQRRLVDTRHHEPVEVLLLRLTVLEGDLPSLGKRKTHHSGALDLRADALGIDVEAAVDRGVDARDRQFSLAVHSDMHHRRNVAQKAPVRGDAASLTRWQRLAPFGLLRRKLRDTAQASRVDRICL